MQKKWGECYYDHFVRFLREPTGREVFQQDDVSPSIQVLWFDGVLSGCRVFCSLGLSNYRQEMGEVAEVVLPVEEAWDEVPYILSNALFFAVQNRIPFGWGVAIGGIGRVRESFAKRYGLSALYFTNPFGFPPPFSNVECRNEVGKIRLGMFLYESEYSFFKERGAREFESLLEAKAVDPFALRRDPCV